MKQLFVEILDTYLDMAPYLFIGLFFAGLLHVVFKKDFIARHLGKNNMMSVIKAAILGVPLPLCSCGVIPTALYLRRQKASEGATVSFLISTPQTGVDSIIATYGMMGPIFAIFRPLAAFVTGIVGGAILNKHAINDAALEKEASSCGCGSGSCEDDVVVEKETSGCGCGSSSCEDTKVVEPVEAETGCGCGSGHSNDDDMDGLSVWEKLKRGFKYAYVEFLDDIALHLMFGVILAGLIAFVIPDSFFTRFDGDGIGGMFIMMAIGIPLYVCATSSIPIAVSLMLKGISPGAAFVFLVAGPATNAATISLIGNTMGKKLLFVYLAVIIVFAFLGGFALNGIFDYMNVDFVANSMSEHHHMDTPLWETILMVLFTIALIPSLYRRLKPRKKTKKVKLNEVKINNMKIEKSNLQEAVVENINEVKIEGMTCNHCAHNVKTSIEAVDGVESVEVDLKGKSAKITGKVDLSKIITAITSAGYKVT